MRTIPSLKRKREEEARAARQAAIQLPNERPNLLLWHTEKPIYIAVCEFGFGIHEIPAAAIRLAQDEVPAKAKPRQLLVYSTFDESVTPVGFERGEPQWPNGAEVRLVGLTTTHSLFVQRPRF